MATLAGGVAHDFNNLLQVILGSAELLQLNSPKIMTDSRELNDVIDAAGRGAKLVQQLLTYSRKIESERRPIHLNDQIEKVHLLLQRTIPKMVAIELCLEKNLNMVEADAVQMEQVLMNLAINAKDAMPSGGRLVIKTANVRHPAKNGGTPLEWVLFSVADTGDGIDKDTREHIFEPFFSTKATGKGTGLGLSMVHGIIKNHNGRISCGSVPGKGTTFHIYLPAAKSLREENRRQKTGAIWWGTKPSFWWMTMKPFGIPVKND